MFALGRDRSKLEVHTEFRPPLGQSFRSETALYRQASSPVRVSPTPVATHDTAETPPMTRFLPRRATHSPSRPPLGGLMPFGKPPPANAARHRWPDSRKSELTRYKHVGTHQVTVVCDGVVTINLARTNYAPPGASKEAYRQVPSPSIICRRTSHAHLHPVLGPSTRGPKLVVIDTGLGPRTSSPSTKCLPAPVPSKHPRGREYRPARRSTPSSIFPVFHGDHITACLAAE